ncbi:response regulator [Gloeobacter violaceus]|uniref:Two-component response regulator n=1 Tax=Gloeobacter violaceus (strain ATCC 29082 / PCC 7421) TaxID=251221 RepID=Q7NNY5_GLOVI|nr:response regulator transcription factor [Gloeobacter violaceus]BAC88214.1 two-component response regulator [Gloeobacter violaceus PCC 7421]
MKEVFINNAEICILIANCHTVVRRGFCSFLRSTEERFCVHEVEDGEQAVQLLGALKPDLVLLDAVLPKMSGVEVIRLFRSKDPSARILMVADDEEQVMLAFHAGANGCLLKSVQGHELLNAVGLVLSGYLVFGQAITRLVAEEQGTGKFGRAAGSVPRLTAREHEVLMLIAQELTNNEIAKRLYISPRTVDSHRARLMGKLGTRNTAGLVRIAAECGLLKAKVG